MTTYGPVAIWSAIIVIGLITYGTRLSFIYLFGAVDDVPPWLERALGFVPPAVLAALAIPSVLTLETSVTASLLDERVFAGLLAGVAAWYTEDVLVTIIVGMGSLWLLRFVIL